jgi:hypothetical protein
MIISGAIKTILYDMIYAIVCKTRKKNRHQKNTTTLANRKKFRSVFFCTSMKEKKKERMTESKAYFHNHEIQSLIIAVVLVLFII